MENKFYEHFAAYYHKIFPVNENVLKSFKDELRVGSLLDVGCGSGEYTNYFANQGFNVTGIDLSKAMIKVAHLRHPAIKFEVANMLTYKSGGPYDNIICIGSTIAHLPHVEDILTFVHLSLANLTPGGVLVIKSLDYSFALDDKVMTMPTINAKNNEVALIRNYELDGDDFFFATTLKTNDEEFTAKTKLLKVTAELFRKLLNDIPHTIKQHERQMTIIIKKEK